MSALVIYASLTGNTRKVAEAIAEEISGAAVDVRHYRPDLAGVTLLFVGCGVYFGRPGRPLRNFLSEFPDFSQVKAAVFGTYGTKPRQIDALVGLLMRKGAQVVDKFTCPGRDLLALGLLNRGRPNAEDLAAARAFARNAAKLAGL